MRTNIEIDDALMAEAQKVSGHATKKRTVEQALRLMVKLRRQHEVDVAFGNTAGAATPPQAAKGEGLGDCCRSRGITVRKTIDLLIGTWCIENQRPLLHNDSDFRPMARQLGADRVAGYGLNAEACGHCSDAIVRVPGTMLYGGSFCSSGVQPAAR